MPSKKIIAKMLIASVEKIESQILFIRGQMVMLHADLRSQFIALINTKYKKW
jgi:hypothetical protein